jgi:hypothetical protein
MRRYRFAKGFALGLTLGVSVTFIYNWDVSAAIRTYAKYKLGEKGSAGAVDTHIVPPAKLFHITFIGSEKDCGPREIHAVPVPGTLWLFGVGLVALWKLKKHD